MNFSLSWKVELFGGLRVVSDKRIITRFRTQKAASLLAYLAYYHGRSHPREHLIELLWPQCLPGSGRNSLSNALSSLRHQLEPPGMPHGAVIVADRNSVRLNSETVTTDVEEFEAALHLAARADSDSHRIHHLDNAVERYGGSLLSGFYENWILLEGQRLNELFFQALQQLVQHHEQLGCISKALRYAQLGVSADPLREEAHCELIRIYAIAGQTTAALRQYAELEHMMREEFNDTPSVAARDLARKLRSALSVTEDHLATGKGQLAPRKRWREKKGTKDEESASVPEPSLQLLTFHSHPSTENFPLRLTRFFGREAEVAWLTERLMGEVRLLTLTGPGGIGKTRLACEVAGRLIERFGGFVCFVSFADISDARLIVETILDALPGPRPPTVEPADQVIIGLSGQPSLLVLDNLEHLLPPVVWDMESGEDIAPKTQDPKPGFQNGISHPTSLILTLLESVPTLKCLVTSRQVLGLTGEREFFVSPLQTPTGEMTPERLVHCESVQLFVDRAQAVKPDFQVTHANASAIAEICERLEGIPLAIELAAARTTVFTVTKMLEQLHDRFDFLVSRKRDLMARHRTLRAAIDWSYQLLAPDLRQFFARLSVFRGGWTREAADNVVALDRSMDESLELLAQLRECSLVLMEESTGDVRFRMLETLREYAREQLSPEERILIARRHRDWYLAFAEEGNLHIRDRQQGIWMARLEAEHDNLNAALQWMTDNGETETRLRMIRALLGFWSIRGYWTKGREWLKQALECEINPESEIQDPTLSALRADVLNGAGDLAFYQADYATAYALFAESLSICRQIGYEEGIAYSLHNLGVVVRGQGDYATAHALLEEALMMNRRMGSVIDEARTLNNLGTLTQHRGDYTKARMFHEQAMVIYHQLGDLAGESCCLRSLCNVAWDQEDYVTARSLCEKSLSLSREVGDKAGIAGLIGALGKGCLRRGEIEQAKSLFEESLSLCTELGDKANIAQALCGLAIAAYRQGDSMVACSMFNESLTICQDMDNKRTIATMVESLAEVLLSEGRMDRVARLLGAGEVVHEAVRPRLSARICAIHDRNVSMALMVLGEDAFAAAWTQGRGMPLEQAIADALKATSVLS